MNCITAAGRHDVSRRRHRIPGGRGRGGAFDAVPRLHPARGVHAPQVFEKPDGRRRRARGVLPALDCETVRRRLASLSYELDLYRKSVPVSKMEPLSSRRRQALGVKYRRFGEPPRPVSTAGIDVFCDDAPLDGPQPE